MLMIPHLLNGLLQLAMRLTDLRTGSAITPTKIPGIHLLDAESTPGLWCSFAYCSSGYRPEDIQLQTETYSNNLA
jgi:hypothetical protein